MSNFSLVKAENEHITKSSGLGIRRQGLYPSEASVLYHDDVKEIYSGKCMRAAWYRAMDYETTNPGGSNLMMKAHLGKWAEQGTIDKWKKMGVWVDNNIKFFDKEYVVSGELDAVIKCPETGELIGIEMKTFYGHFANSEICGAKGRKKDGSDRKPGKPKIDQFLQAVYYSNFYVNELKKLDEYRMYYLERGDGHRVEFRVGAEEESGQCWYQQISGEYWGAFDENKVYFDFTISQVRENYIKLRDMLVKKELPDKCYQLTYDEETARFKFEAGDLGKTKYDAFKKNPEKNPVGDWQCSYCNFRDQCEKDEAEKK